MLGVSVARGHHRGKIAIARKYQIPCSAAIKHELNSQYVALLSKQ